LFSIFVRLLLLRQVAQFSMDGEELFLFVHDHNVYRSALTTTVQRRSRLPQTSSSHVFIWSLVFDIEKRIEPQALLVVRVCLLVRQPLDPIRYNTWDKYQTSLVTGTPS
jgi:hypothetical protein